MVFLLKNHMISAVQTENSTTVAIANHTKLSFMYTNMILIMPESKNPKFLAKTTYFELTSAINIVKNTSVIWNKI